MPASLKQLILFASTTCLLILAGWYCYQIHLLSERHGEINKDYSRVNSIGTGLLSVNVWRDNFLTVMNQKIDSFHISPGQRDTIRAEIQSILHSVLNKADTILSKKQKTLSGKIKSAIANAFIDEDKIHRQVPEFSETILRKALSPPSRKKLKHLVKGMLNDLSESTYDSTRISSEREHILTRYHVGDIDSFNKKCEQLTTGLKEQIYHYTYIVLGILVAFLILWWLLRKQASVHKPFFIISVLLAFEVLLVGLTTPMIEIDARIKAFDFHLIGTQIKFNDQVIFFQSKSITDVVHILMATGKYDSILVGMLVLVFSIVFPISKLLSAGIYLLGSEKYRHNKIVTFFAFKSGKWSMADVNVIAIFMAYIGFKGILTDQISKINVENSTVTSIATNQTSLQPGYIIFVSFVLFGLALSTILEKITSHEYRHP